MKKLVIILCVILAAGIVLAVTGMIVYTATGGADMSKYEPMQQKADVSEVKTIKVKCAIEQINVKAIDGNEVVFDYFEGSKLKHDFTAENGEITMAIKKTSWFWGFWWGFDTSKLIMNVGVPRDFAGEIDVYTETGKVEVADLKNLRRIEATATTGSVSCANVKAESGKTPIAGGENGCSIFEYKQLIDKKCLDIIQPDVTHAGGIGEVKKAAEYAALNGITVAPHVFRSGASFAAHLNLLSAIPNALICEFQQVANPLREELLNQPIKMVNGEIVIPDEPGLGIHLTDDIIKKYPYKPGTEQRFKVENV